MGIITLRRGLFDRQTARKERLFSVPPQLSAKIASVGGISVRPVSAEVAKYPTLPSADLNTGIVLAPTAAMAVNTELAPLLPATWPP